MRTTRRGAFFDDGKDARKARKALSAMMMRRTKGMVFF